MVVYRIYYLMVDRASKNVSSIWKILHLWTQFMAAGTGIVSAWYFHIILQGFGHNCPLYAKVEFSLLRPNSVGFNLLPKNVTVNLRESVWGNDMYCQYSFTVWMTSFVGSLILCTFFIWSKSGGAGDPQDSFIQPWKHILPTLLVSICLMGATSVATYFVTNGLDAFCKEFRPYIDTDRCNYKIDAFSLPFANKVLKVNQAIIMVRSCAPVCVIAWICHTVTLFVRICISPDFDVQIIKITGIKKSDTDQSRKPSWDMEGEYPNIKRLPSSFTGFRGSLPSLHAFVAPQLDRPSTVRFSVPDIRPKKSEEYAMGPSSDKKQWWKQILLPRPSDYDGESSEPMPEPSQLIRSVMSDTSLKFVLPKTIEKQILPPAEGIKPPSDTGARQTEMRIIQPAAAFRALTTTETLRKAIKEVPLAFTEQLVRKMQVKRANVVKHTRFATEELVPPAKKVTSFDTEELEELSSKHDLLERTNERSGGDDTSPKPILKKSSEPPLDMLAEFPPEEEILSPKQKTLKPEEEKQEVPKPESTSLQPEPEIPPPPLPTLLSQLSPLTSESDEIFSNESQSLSDRSGSVEIPKQRSASPEALLALREQRIQRPLDGTSPRHTPQESPSRALQTVDEEALTTETQLVRRLPSTTRIEDPSARIDESFGRFNYLRPRPRRQPDPMPPPFVDDRPEGLSSFFTRPYSRPQLLPAPIISDSFQGILPINYRASLLMASSPDFSDEVLASMSQHTNRQDASPDDLSVEPENEREPRRSQNLRQSSVNVRRGGRRRDFTARMGTRGWQL